MLSVRPKGPRAVADGGRALSVYFILTALVAPLFCTACHWVDLQCASLTAEARRQERSLGGTTPGFLWLTLQLRSGLVLLRLDGFGHWRYSEDALTICRNLGQEKFETIAKFWRVPALDGSGPICGPGYAYVPSGHQFRDLEGICAEAWDGVAQRAYAYLPYMEMTHNPEGTRVLDGKPARLLWDLESPLPEALDEAATGMFGFLCEESRKLSRIFRRGHPELAAWAGCLKEEP